jgi:hypothetical protein
VSPDNLATDNVAAAIVELRDGDAHVGIVARALVILCMHCRRRLKMQRAPAKGSRDGLRRRR